jgi:hypothetical protein
MHSEKRKQVRYDDVGRLDAPDVCTFPGMLLDISLGGCKGHFPCMLAVDEEGEHMLKILPMHKNSARTHSFALLGRPIWEKQEGSFTIVGFRFLHSPDLKRLTAYVEQLESDRQVLLDEA